MNSWAARQYGVVFAIDTDGHAVPHLDYIRYGVAVAQPGWVSAEEVINTWPLDRLRKFLAKGRRRADDVSTPHHRAGSRPH
jgi:DNA polymerase (family 10)